MTFLKYHPKITTGFVIFILSASPAYAYLDPATATIILQVIIGAIAGGIVYVKLYWDKVKKIFNKIRGKSTDTASLPKSDDPTAGEDK